MTTPIYSKAKTYPYSHQKLKVSLNCGASSLLNQACMLENMIQKRNLLGSICYMYKNAVRMQKSVVTLE